jgi:hypothetical protein
MDRFGLITLTWSQREVDEGSIVDDVVVVGIKGDTAKVVFDCLGRDTDEPNELVIEHSW